MDDVIEKFEIANIDKFIKYLSYKSFLDILLDKVKDSFTLSFNNTNEEYNFKVETRADPLALENLRTREFILSQKTIENLRGNLRFELLSGLEANESIDQIKKRLDKIFVTNAVNTERIARTEILHSMNSGRMEAYRTSGVVSHKMWQAAINNARTAADSKRLHGQIQKLQDPFVDPKTGDTFMHPPNRPQCRCTILPLTRLPDDVVTTGGIMYAADKKVGKIEIPIDLLKSRQKRKAWVVRYANGYAVQCFEDEKDADHFIETSKKKDAGWFDFINKVYREVKKGWTINKKGTKITFKTMSGSERTAFDEKLLTEDKRVNKIEIDVNTLNKKEIWIPQTAKRVGHWRKISTRKKGVKPPEEVTPKTGMVPENVKNISTLNELGMSGGVHDMESFIVEFDDGSKAMYKVMIEGSIIGEIGTYNVSKILNWDVIPETTKGNFGMGKGSCQKWVDDSVEPYEGHEYVDYKKVEERHFDNLSKIFIIDMIVGNYDRHNSNVMIDDNDKCWAIDNEDWGIGDSASNFIEALEYSCGIISDFRMSPMTQWMKKNLNKKEFLVFRKKIIGNMKYVIENNTKIINYYNNYSNTDLIVSEIPIKEVITNIKDNLDYIKKYYGKNK